MKYENPDVYSSYKENDLGKTLYDTVIRLKPKIIVEFGTLHGYSAIAMAMACHENKYGHITCYDLWDTYPYRHSTMDETRANIEKYGLSSYITLKQMDFDDWILTTPKFDLLHLDISNDGLTFKKAYDALNYFDAGTIILEGGSEERDNVEWMKKYDRTTMNSIKEYTGYAILNDKFPSISMM